MSQGGAKLLLRMFGGRTRAGRQKSLLHHTEHVLKSGVVEEPLWLDAIRETPPPAILGSTGRPPKITFPEDKLIAAYYKRNPTARFMPIDMNSEKPHFVQRFAWRQLALMEGEGLSEEAALKRVETEVATATRRQASGRGGGVEGELTAPPMQRRVLAETQAEEEQLIAAALKKGGMRGYVPDRPRGGR